MARKTKRPAAKKSTRKPAGGAGRKNVRVVLAHAVRTVRKAIVGAATGAAKGAVAGAVQGATRAVREAPASDAPKPATA
jgi:hypothetical protein